MTSPADNPTTYRLHYFNLLGRAEIARFIFAYSGIEFDDIRHKKEDWAVDKQKFPSQQLPALEIISGDGKNSRMLVQSLAISRYLAGKFGLLGSTPLESAQCDEVVECVNDLLNAGASAYAERDEDLREKAVEKMKTVDCPRLLGFLELRLQENGGKHFVGSDWTWADFSIAVFFEILQERSIDYTIIEELCPGIVALATAVEKLPKIAAWIEKRPESTLQDTQ